jgi:hypothetical protein
VSRLKDVRKFGLLKISIGVVELYNFIKGPDRMNNMDRESANRINEEIERYKNALLYYRKFFGIFKLILFVLVIIIFMILKMNSKAYPALLRFKDSMVIMAITGSCFELYFFLDFRLYVEHKMSRYNQRREQFIMEWRKISGRPLLNLCAAYDNLGVSLLRTGRDGA